MSQTERIFYLIDLLFEKGYFKREEVAKHFEVSTKQIWRDKEYLENRCPLSCGNLDIVYDRSIRAYRLTEESKERLSLWRASESLSLAKDIENGNRPKSSISTISNDIKYIRYKSYARETFSTDVYNDILRALKENKKVKLSYTSIKNKSERIVEPLKLVNYTEIWYLIAALDGSILTFSLSRIEKVEILNEDISFNNEEALERVLSGYGIYEKACQARLYTIRFYSWAARVVSRQVWQKDQSMKFLEDGETLELTLPITNHTELLSRILFYGECAEPIAPSDFVAEYRAKCIAMGKRYV